MHKDWLDYPTKFVSEWNCLTVEGAEMLANIRDFHKAGYTCGMSQIHARNDWEEPEFENEDAIDLLYQLYMKEIIKNAKKISPAHDNGKKWHDL